MNYEVFESSPFYHILPEYDKNGEFIKIDFSDLNIIRERRNRFVHSILDYDLEAIGTKLLPFLGGFSVNEWKCLLSASLYVRTLSVVAVRSKLEKYKSILCNLNDDTILVKGNEVILNDDLECFELLVSIMLFKPNYHKFVMELSAISNEFLHKSEFLHSIEIFKERECYIVFVNNLGLDTSVIQITVAQNNEEAITMF